jgi:hypothetical protein
VSTRSAGGWPSWSIAKRRTYCQMMVLAVSGFTAAGQLGLDGDRKKSSTNISCLALSPTECGRLRIHFFSPGSALRGDASNRAGNREAQSRRRFLQRCHRRGRWLRPSCTRDQLGTKSSLKGLSATPIIIIIPSPSLASRSRSAWPLTSAAVSRSASVPSSSLASHLSAHFWSQLHFGSCSRRSVCKQRHMSSKRLTKVFRRCYQHQEAGDSAHRRRFGILDRGNCFNYCVRRLSAYSRTVPYRVFPPDSSVSLGRSL